MKYTKINRKKYKVYYVFNAVGNYYFDDERGVSHLVDAEDVALWVDEQGLKHNGIDTAIAYAKYVADGNDGVFWWKQKKTRI